MRTLIVTPDVIGPVNNGGIGTHCFYLATSLAQREATTVLFTGECQVKTIRYWKSVYAEMNVHFEDLTPWVERLPPIHGNWSVTRSLAVWEFIKNAERSKENFSTVHFQDWHGNGFIPIQAKKVGGRLPQTTLTVTLHSPSLWQRQGMRSWMRWPLPDTVTEYCERYAVENADTVISPSRHMLSWAAENKWVLPADCRVIPYFVEPSRSNAILLKEGDQSRHPQIEAPNSVNTASEDFIDLVFFGRLETRKGLEIFFDGIEMLPPSAKARVRDVFLIGKHGNTSEGTSRAFLENRPMLTGLNVKTLPDLNSAEALALIRSRPVLVVVPSLLDNSPFVIHECQAAGVPVVGTRVGGIPEVLPAAMLCDSSAQELSKLLARCLLDPTSIECVEVDMRQREATWLSLGEQPRESLPSYQETVPPNGIRRIDNAESQSGNSLARPKVTICIAFFNYGKYLPSLVDALQSQTYRNMEVIVVNDGSSELRSQRVFHEMTEKDLPGFRWIQSENRGIGAARNLAASHADGDFLIFVDADNIPMPHMVEELVRAVERSQLDVVTCHFVACGEDQFPDFGTEILYRYAPPGSSLAAGTLTNVFGDANAIIRREAFNSVGGFTCDRDKSWEDYELFARLVLSGFTLDVLPEPLFWYRHTPNGVSRTTRQYDNHDRILRVYRECTDAKLIDLWDLLASYHYRFDDIHEGVNSESLVNVSLSRLVKRLRKLGDRFLPVGSRRRSWVRRGLVRTIY